MLVDPRGKKIDLSTIRSSFFLRHRNPQKFRISSWICVFCPPGDRPKKDVVPYIIVGLAKAKAVDWVVVSQRFFSCSSLHPGRLTWNLRIHPWKRKIIFRTIIFRFYVNLPGCTWGNDEKLTSIPRKFNSSPLKIGLLPKGNSSSKPSFFRGELLNFGGVIFSNGLVETTT